MLRALLHFHTCRRQYPGTATDSTLCSQPSAVSDFPASTGRSSCTSPFSRLAQRSLTLRPACSSSHLVTLYTEGFSHFVTSMTAPITTGRSKFSRVGFAPTAKAPPFHGARRVEMWRAGRRLGLSVVRPFRLAVPQYPHPSCVSTSRSSNPACRFPAPGSRTKGFMHSPTAFCCVAPTGVQDPRSRTGTRRNRRVNHSFGTCASSATTGAAATWCTLQSPGRHRW